MCEGGGACVLCYDYLAMGTISQSMSATVDKAAPCCTMGSNAAKDKLVSAVPFGIGTGHFHFGGLKENNSSNNRGGGGGAGGGGVGGGGDTYTGSTMQQNANITNGDDLSVRSTKNNPSLSPVRRNVNSGGDLEVNGYNQDRGCLPLGLQSPRVGQKRPTPPKPPPKPAGLARLANLRCARMGSVGGGGGGGGGTTLGSEMLKDVRFLSRFFCYFAATERRLLAQVCSSWRNVLYQARFWRGVLPVVNFRQMRVMNGDPLTTVDQRLRFYGSLQQRGFDSVCLCGGNDDDIRDFVTNCPSAAKHIHHVVLRCSSITDKGLEILLDGMQSVYQLELVSCNEVSEAGLWSSLNPRIVSLTIHDCINVADESLGAVSQLLPSLYEFNLQAYHVTDSALTYFSPKQSGSLSILRLQSCWEISNQGIGNLVHALPNLTVLSLAGCSKVTDAGIEVIAENLKKLKSLDLSWCPRITDAALEYIACDLTQLEQLTLDRCVHITDIGIGYVSTMLSLNALFLRWCSQMRDFGLQHLCSMRNLQVLSVAGCPLLSAGGLSALIQLRHLRELELTNCPGASQELFDYLRQHLPHCLIIE